MPLRWCLAAMLGMSLAACLEAPPEGGGVPDPDDGRIDLVVRAGMVIDDLQSYPLLVELTEVGELAAGPREDASDLSFVDESGAALPHEIEYWDPDGGTLRAWVSVPTLFAGKDTRLSLRYGDPSGLVPSSTDVWFDFDGVWHLDTMVDSTSWTLVGALEGDATLAEGVIGGGLVAVAGFMIIEEQPDGHLDYGGGDSFSISAWLRRDGDAGTYQTFLSKGGTGTDASGYSLETDDDGDELFGCLSDVDEYSCANPGASLPIGAWSLFTLVADRQLNEFHLYQDGAVASTFVEFDNLQPEENNDFDLVLGADEVRQHTVIGAIDEVRVARRTLSQAWILADVVSQGAPELFVEVVE